jgi:hypothetical protein
MWILYWKVVLSFNFMPMAVQRSMMGIRTEMLIYKVILSHVQTAVRFTCPSVYARTREVKCVCLYTHTQTYIYTLWYIYSFNKMFRGTKRLNLECETHGQQHTQHEN